MKKATRKNKPGAGRPHRSLDEERIGQMAFDGCKNSEIAHVLGCDDATLKKNYSRILNKKRAERKAALRNVQTISALAGDIPMMIWLGKNELEQTDKHAGESSDKPIYYQIVYEDPAHPAGEKSK